MEEKISREERLRRGEHAMRIVADPMFDELLRAVEARITMKWRNAKTPADREYTHTQMTSLTELAVLFRAVAEDGVRVRAEIDREKNTNVPTKGR